MDKKVVRLQNVSHRCIVCGIHNEASFKTQFAECADGTLIGVPDVKDHHQSYPNRMHGGVISALIDEVVGRAVQIAEPDTWGVTGTLSVRYIRPVPLDRQIYVTGKITRCNRLMFEGEGGVYLAATGELLASGTAKYMKLPVGEIADAVFMHTEWVKDERPLPDIAAFKEPQN